MSLVGWWPLDGNAENKIGGGDSYEVGSVQYSNGKLGECYDNTSGSNTGIELLRHDDFVPYESNYSFSLWFKSTTTSGSSSARVISRDASDYPTFVVRQDESSPQSTRLYEATEDGPNISINKWHHLVFTIDVENSNSQLFIDGDLYSTGGYNGDTSAVPYVLGGNTEGDGDVSGNHFTGKIDDVRLYDHVLSKKEVQQLSQAKVLHYTFDKSPESVVNGITSGIGNNDLTFYPDQWGGSSNKGEIDIGGNYFEDFDGTSYNITPINNGIATQDSGTGSFYIMYSAESVHNRFSNGSPHGSNCDHLIGVGRIDGEWKYDDNGSWNSFTVVDSDRLVGTYTKETGNVTSAQKIHSLSVGDGVISDQSGHGNNGAFSSSITATFDDGTTDGFSVSNGGVKSDESVTGEYSIGSDNDGEINATWTPNDLSGGEHIDSFEYYWWEETSQSGHRVSLYDANDNLIQYSETENPQWILSNGSGEDEIRGYDGQGYNNWTKFRFEFNWEAGTYEYHLEDETGEYVSTGTQDLRNTNGVERIQIHGPTGSANYCRFDAFDIKHYDSDGIPTHTSDSKIGSGAFEFDGGKIESIEQSLNLSEITLSTWIRPEDMSNQYAGVVGSNIPKAYNDFILRRNNSDNYQFALDWDKIRPTIPANELNEGSGEWHNITATFDGKVAKLYLDGVEYSSASDSSATLNYNGIKIGNYYYQNYPYNGAVDDVRLYASALSADEVQEIYQQRASIDAGGSFHTTDVLETKHRGRIADYTEWELETSGSQGSFSQNGDTSENDIVEYTDPFGKKVPTWKCSPESDDGSDGGWGMSFTGDNSQRLRMSVFVKRTGSSMNGSYYHGCDNGGNTLTLGGSTDGNPYFHSGNLPSNNTWYLLVGLLHPNDYDGSEWGVSGVYDMNGKKVSGGSEYKWGSSNNQKLRDYLFYSTDTSERQYFVYPRIDVIDGNEPSIQDLVNGLDSRVYDHVSNINTSKPQSLAITPERSVVSEMNEVGPAPQNLVGWWPLDGDARDYSGNENHGTVNGASVTSGLGQSAYDFDSGNDDIRVSDDSSLDVTGEITVSVWKEGSDRGDTFHSVINKHDGSNGYSIEHGWGTDNYSEIGSFRFSNDYDKPFSFNWEQAVLRYDGTDVDVFVDGQLKNTDTHTGGIGTTSNDLLIGNGWDGPIQDVRIYDKALSTSEIETLYNLTDPRQDQRVIQTDTGELHAKNQFNERL